MTEIWVLSITPNMGANRDEVLVELQKFLMKKFGVKATVKDIVESVWE